MNHNELLCQFSRIKRWLTHIYNADIKGSRADEQNDTMKIVSQFANSGLRGEHFLPTCMLSDAHSDCEFYLKSGRSPIKPQLHHRWMDKRINYCFESLFFVCVWSKELDFLLQNLIALSLYPMMKPSFSYWPTDGSVALHFFFHFFWSICISLIYCPSVCVCAIRTHVSGWMAAGDMWFTKSYSAAARWGEECVSVCVRAKPLAAEKVRYIDFVPKRQTGTGRQMDYSGGAVSSGPLPCQSP